jgi:hypothetical protein
MNEGTFTKIKDSFANSMKRLGLEEPVDYSVITRDTHTLPKGSDNDAIVIAFKKSKVSYLFYNEAIYVIEYPDIISSDLKPDIFISSKFADDMLRVYTDILIRRVATNGKLDAIEAPEFTPEQLKILESLGFKGEDVGLDISLFEYGAIYSAKSGVVIWRNFWDGATPDYKFGWDRLSVDEVFEQLDVIEKGFYDYVGTEKENYKEQSKSTPEIAINDMRRYNNAFDPEYNIDNLDAILKIINQ